MAFVKTILVMALFYLSGSAYAFECTAMKMDGDDEVILKDEKNGTMNTQKSALIGKYKFEALEVIKDGTIGLSLSIKDTTNKAPATNVNLPDLPEKLKVSSDLQTADGYFRLSCDYVNEHIL
jgi:hypothetical protein